MVVGRRLREARTERGLATSDIARRTNIPVPVLDAIERGDVAHIPGGLFVRAYLRAYASQVGLPPDEIVAAYQAEREPEPVEDELRDLRRRWANRDGSGADRAQTVLVAIGIAILVIVGLLFSRPETRAGAPEPDVAQDVRVAGAQ
jgi:cytoskeletal protein RodZ